MKYLQTTMPPALAAAIALAGPAAAASLPVATGYVEAQEVPVRVYYATPEQEALAPSLLDAAVYAWTIQIKNMGFATPITVDDDLNPVEGARLYLVAGGGFAGMAKPFCDVPDTPQADCAR